VLGVDGGNSKTDVVVATTEGEPLRWTRGGGSNAHGKRWYAGCVDVIDGLVGLDEPADRAVLFLCGADLPQDIVGLTDLARERNWAHDLTIDNDTFALLYAGTDRSDAIAVICGSGLNCVARSGDRVARWPTLGWETGDWGGAGALGREALFAANRAADGRARPTALVGLIESRFGKPTSTTRRCTTRASASSRRRSSRWTTRSPVGSCAGWSTRWSCSSSARSASSG
jgi:N-acetylglucosamine kinase-like BadF-type ATPase